MPEHTVREYYNAEAWRYDRSHGAGQFGAQYGIRTHYLPFWKRYIRKQDTVLEIGCGTGVFTQQLRKLCRSITAVDLSPNMVEQARRRNPGLAIRVASAERLPFTKGTFDAIVCINSFSYILHQQRALREIRRVLKRKGALLIIDVNIVCPAYWIMYFTRHRRLRLFFRKFLRSNRQSLQKTLEGNGFSVRECRTGNFVPHGVGKFRARALFIPMDKAMRHSKFMEQFSMRVFCAAYASNGRTMRGIR